MKSGMFFAFGVSGSFKGVLGVMGKSGVEWLFGVAG